MFTPKYSVILGNVGACCDRYMSCGYSEGYTLEQLFDRVASIQFVEGVELVADWHITPENAERIRENLERTGLKLVSIIPDHFGLPLWGKGAFTSKEEAVRQKAIAHTQQMMDVAAQLGGDLVSLWPGQDGYDYYFQADYINERTLFEKCVQACCDYRSDIRVSIEYKPKEPRNRSYPSNVYSTLLMVNEINRDNCGITIDYGHALVAYENVAESVAVLKKYGDKLFHFHMNDNYGFWDDDMIVGSIHTIPYFELFYWLKRTGYQGYISTDQYPYREDGRDAVNESVQWMKIFENMVNSVDESVLDELLTNGDAVKVSSLLRKELFSRFI